MSTASETQRDTTLTRDAQHTWAQAVTFSDPDAFNDDPIYFRTRGEALADLNEWLETDTWYTHGETHETGHTTCGSIVDRRTGVQVGTWSVHQARA